jgi:hypothetical protein
MKDNECRKDLAKKWEALCGANHVNQEHWAALMEYLGIWFDLEPETGVTICVKRSK